MKIIDSVVFVKVQWTVNLTHTHVYRHINNVSVLHGNWLLIQDLIKNSPSDDSKLFRHIKHTPLMPGENTEVAASQSTKQWKQGQKCTIMRFGVPTVALAKEDCSLVGYDTLCACSTDMFGGACSFHLQGMYMTHLRLPSWISLQTL